MSLSSYFRQVYEAPAGLEEDLVAELWLMGTLGVGCEPAERGRVRLTAWFEGGPPPALEQPWRRRGVEAGQWEASPEIDWLAAYRAQARPFAVGESVFVDPREPDPGAGGHDSPPVPAGRRLLRLPARAAFGTGSHESTALAVELLEGLDLQRRSVLDVGSGTGILAFVALARGAERVVALDCDPIASFHGRVNGRLNGLEVAFFAGRLAALAPATGGRFDLAVANIVPEQILPELPLLAGLLRPGGGAVFSGILAERSAALLARLDELGLPVLRELRAGEWVAYHCSLRRGRPDAEQA